MGLACFPYRSREAGIFKIRRKSMKLVPTALAGAVTIAFAQVAMAQAPRVIAPNSGNTSIEQQGVQNSTQLGSGNQSSQVLGNDNTGSNTSQSGAQNQNATSGQSATGAQQSQQYGSGNASSQGGTSAYEKNRQSNMPYSQQRGAQNQNSYGSGNQQNQQYGTGNRSAQAGSYSSNDRYENNAASGGQTRDREDERHDNGKHKGQYKNGRGDEHARGDDDHDRRGRRGGDRD